MFHTIKIIFDVAFWIFPGIAPSFQSITEVKFIFSNYIQGNNRYMYIDHTRVSMAHFESNYSSYYGNYGSIRTSTVVTIVRFEHR